VDHEPCAVALVRRVVEESAKEKLLVGVTEATYLWLEMMVSAEKLVLYLRQRLRRWSC